MGVLLIKLPNSQGAGAATRGSRGSFVLAPNPKIFVVLVLVLGAFLYAFLLGEVSKNKS